MKKVRLNEVCSFLSGYAWTSKDFQKVGNIPIIRIQNLNDSIPDYIYWNNDYDEKFVITTLR
jgi:type I restriction enzyme, S subunit